MTTDIIALGMPGGPELFIVVLIVVFLFGAKRLPELARSVGRSLTEFKKGRDEGLLDEPDDGADADEPKRSKDASGSYQK